MARFAVFGQCRGPAGTRGLSAIRQPGQGPGGLRGTPPPGGAVEEASCV